LRVAAGVLIAFTIACGPGGDYPRREPAPGADGITFTPNQVCAECHEKEFREWQGSDHDLAMQPANEETVRGDFGDVSFTHFGVTSRFFRRGDKFVVNTEGPDGELHDYEIKYTFGYEPLQQYLIPFPGGRLQCLTVAWDTKQKRWFSLYPDEKIEADDPLHWTGWSQRWNLMCAECHSTNLRKNYDQASKTYKTAWDEIDVSCQACHGPGQAHVEWGRMWPKDMKAKPEQMKLVVNFKGGDSRYQVDQCARCHSRRHQVSPDNLHGRPFMDDYMVALLRENLYFADGQILDEVYVYGSFLQSKMYHRGVRCSDCHNPHTLGFQREGNALCTECHQASPPARFPTLKKKNYDTPKHHHHEMGSDSARCVQCHMVARTYMVVDPRRDHSFRIPRPDLTLALGTPNACKQCHEDKPVTWAIDALAKWYGRKPAEPHFATAFARARQGNPGAAPALISLAGDPQQPTIVRATAIDLLQNYGGQGVETIRAALTDQDALVRTVAAHVLSYQEPAERILDLGPLLGDPIRAVRIEAARALAGVGSQYLSEEQRKALGPALEQYVETQVASTDTPGANLNLGLIEAAKGNTGGAVEDYRHAIEIDRTFLPAQLNLATLYNELGRNDEAEKVLRGAILGSPNNGDLRYSLGLLLAEQQRLAEAAASLGEAAALMPSRARVRYNYALALQHLGRRSAAERELLAAHEADPRDPSIVNALVIFYIQQQRLEEAQVYAVKLVNLAPNQPGPRQMLQRIEQELRRRN